MREMVVSDEIGAHVSNAGGVQNAPARAAALDAAVFQLFTKQAQRWAEPVYATECAASFRASSSEHNIRVRASHDSYLINLASPDPLLRERSIASFAAELERCTALGVELLVTHPGNATDGDADSGIDRNADGLLDAIGVTRAKDLLDYRNGQRVRVAGVKVATQTPPVKSGQRIIFLSLEPRSMSRDMSGRYGPIYSHLTTDTGTTDASGLQVRAITPHSTMLQVNCSAAEVHP